MTCGAVPVVRGCGTRKQGGIYFESGLSPDGLPVEDSLCDPPVLVDNWHLSAVGVQLIERHGVTHIVDWVGSSHYPNVADFIEEVRRFGVSRRLSSKLDFSRITPATRILLVHPKAWINNIDSYGTWNCPKHLPGHRPEILLQEPQAQARMCAGVWWSDIEEGQAIASNQTETDNLERDVKRTMPAFSYFARCRPESVTPKYRPAIFASFPCSRLVVVKGKHEQNWEKANRSSVVVNEVEQ